MNKKYIDTLIKRNKVGLILSLIKNNEYFWSVNDFQYVFDCSIRHNLNDIFYFLVEFFNKKDCIKIFNDNINIYKNLRLKYRNSNLEIFKYILKIINFNNSDEHNISDWYLSLCGHGEIEIVKYISLNFKSEINNEQYDTFIRYARIFNNIKILKYLLSTKMEQLYQGNRFSHKYNNYNFSCSSSDMSLGRELIYILSSTIKKIYPNISRYPKNNGFGWIFLDGQEEINEYLTNSDTNSDHNEYKKYGCICGNEDKHKNIIKILLSDEIQERYPILNTDNSLSDYMIVSIGGRINQTYKS